MKTRDEMINSAVLECLEMLYKYSVPSMSFSELQEKVNLGKTYDKEYFAHHYIPQNLYDEIIERFQQVYGMEKKWKNHCEIISEYLFNGGLKEVYKKDDNGISHREYEKTKPLSEIIGEDNANKVKELLDNCMNFYRFDRTADSFTFSVGNYGPSTFKKTAEEYWNKDSKCYSFDDEEIKNRYYKEEYGEE